MIESHVVEDQAVSAKNNVDFRDDTTFGSIASSLDDHSLVDTARYFAHPRPRPPFRPPPSINLRSPQALDAPSSSNPKMPPPWDLERRRSSTSDIRSAASSWPRDTPTPTAFAARGNHRDARPQTPSTVSTSSVSSSSSSVSASSASVSPRLHSNSHYHPHHRHHHHLTELHHPRHHERRHSSHLHIHLAK